MNDLKLKSGKKEEWLWLLGIIKIGGCQGKISGWGEEE